MSKTKASALDNLSVGKRELINLGLFLLLLYALLPQVGKFRTSLKIVWHGQLGWIITSLLLAVATSFLAALVVFLLSKKRLRYSRILAVQFAGLFANRLLPAGVGSLGVNYEYLRRNRHSQVSAGAVIATITFIGLVGHILLLSSVLLATGSSFSQFSHLHVNRSLYLFALIGVVVLVVVLLWFKKLRNNIVRFGLGSFKNIASYRTHPLKLLSALLASMGLTLLYSLCLLSCAWSVGIHLSLGQTLIILTVGVAGGTLAPTPGGLIGAEAGLFAGLITCNVASPKALAIVLIYRFLTYWLALAFGALAWVLVRRQNFI